ncbi:DoxX family protein [Streptomyces sp. NPDC087659]|uniref:DoxX family protein n=1 Tax=Streptomyces sp. NPDC087659 TaxID=3365801 RepID=UPI00382E16C5
MTLTTALLSCALAAFMTFAGAPKLASGPRTRLMAEHLRVPPELLRLIGLAEIAAAIGLIAGLALSGLGIAAAGGLAVLMAGGVLAHLRVKDPFTAAAPALAAAVVAAALVILHLAGT